MKGVQIFDTTAADGENVGQYIKIYRKVTKTVNGDKYIIAIYGAMKLFNCVLADRNGIVVLNLTKKAVVADKHLQTASGKEGETSEQVAEFNRLIKLHGSKLLLAFRAIKSFRGENTLGLSVRPPKNSMRLRVMLFDEARAEYDGQWSEAMAGNLLDGTRYTVMMDVSDLQPIISDETGPDRSDDNVLHAVRKWTQNDNPALKGQSWREVLSYETLLPCRSSCAGDLFLLNDRWFLLGETGFHDITAHVRNFEETPRQVRAGRSHCGSLVIAMSCFPHTHC